MKTSRLLLVAGLMVVGAVVLAQTNFPARWSPVSWRFQIDGVPHAARIEHQAVLAAQPWNPSKPLPVGLDAVEHIARKELRKLVPDDGVWEVIGFELSRLQSPLNSSNWFYTVRFRTSVPRQEGPVTNYLEHAEVLVDFNGKPGFFDDN
jgi:hypothetical protein